MNDRERATILAALRMWQASMDGSDPDVDVLAIATNEGEFGLLDSGEVDQLCERVNTGGPERVYVVITADSGIVEGAALFRDGDKADAHAREEWRAMTGSSAPDGDSITGTHDDEHDVWLFEERIDGGSVFSEA